MRAAVEERINNLGAYGYMMLAVLKDLFKRGPNTPELVKQIVLLGERSIPIVFLTAVFTGMVLAIQTAYGLQRFGAKFYVGNIVSLSLVRELGPVLTAIMLCGRTGAGIAAEIGSMVVTEQVDAIRALGADPIRKLVSPRILAAVISVPLLTALADIFGILGGAAIAIWELEIGAHHYYRSVVNFVTLQDVFDGLIKSFFFGLLYSSIACFKGLQCRGGTEGVGHTTTEAVVIGSVVILISDFFLTKALILLW